MQLSQSETVNHGNGKNNDDSNYDNSNDIS